jgi:hypothetical protein
MMPRVFCGTFEAEAYWRDRELAKLPSLSDRNSSRIVQAMDEMLFCFCGPGDTVLTAKSMDDAHSDYLHAVGFPFNRNRFDLSPLDDKGSPDETEMESTIFQRMVEEPVTKQVEVLCPAGALLEPFAVLPGTAEVAKRYGLSGEFPSQDIIRSVNTKGYSLHMRDRLGIENMGVTVGDVASLLDRGSKLLQHGPVLVKDDYGVSGKGNQLIETQHLLQRIAKHLSAQAAAGKRVRFILEPYLRKRSDFSCQFRIEDDGRVTVISVQELVNNGLAFGASCTVGPEFLDRLERDGYFQLIGKIGSLMYTDGYYGDVCVDSMILHEGKLAPLVEINARKSMSLIKHAIDQYLMRLERKGCLTYVSAVNDQSSDFSCLLELLEREHLLLTTKCDLGILPLTSGTMYLRPSSEPEKPVRGRLYIAAVFEKPEHQADLIARLGRVMELAGLHITR